MSKRIILSAVLVAFVAAEASAQNRFHRRRGALLGGLAGAAVGAVIGDKGDNETAGALIGGAVGAVAGGAIGDQKDRRIRQQHYHAHQTQQYRQQLSEQQAINDWQAQQLAQQQTQQRAARALSTADVVTLVRRGVGEATIIQYIRANGVRQRLGVSDIISLHEQGVSEPIINAMQTAPAVLDNNSVLFEDPAFPNRRQQDQRVITEGQGPYGQSIIVSPQTVAPIGAHPTIAPHPPVAPAQPANPWGLAPPQ